MGGLLARQAFQACNMDGSGPHKRMAPFVLDRMPPKLPGGHVGHPTATHLGWLLSCAPTLQTKTSTHEQLRADAARIHSFNSRGGGGGREQAAPVPIISHGAVRRPPRISGGCRRGAVLLLHVRPWYCMRNSVLIPSLVAMELDGADLP